MIDQGTYNRIYKSGYSAGLVEKLRGQEMASADQIMDAAADRIERLETALRAIAYSRPLGDLNTAKNTRALVGKFEAIALQALSEGEQA